MFWIQRKIFISYTDIVGIFLGANVSLILYACIIAGKESDRKYEHRE